MTKTPQEAGRQAAVTSAQGGKPLQTAHGAGYTHPDSAKSFNAGVAQGQKQVSDKR